MEEWKMEEVRKREKEAKAYLAAQKSARDKGMPIPGVDDKPSHGKHSTTFPSRHGGKAFLGLRGSMF
jgi:hypothetical protein